jgi:hypothetical protein
LFEEKIKFGRKRVFPMVIFEFGACSPASRSAVHIKFQFVHRTTATATTAANRSLPIVVELLPAVVVRLAVDVAVSGGSSLHRQRQFWPSRAISELPGPHRAVQHGTSSFNVVPSHTSGTGEQFLLRSPPGHTGQHVPAYRTGAAHDVSQLDGHVPKRMHPQEQSRSTDPTFRPTEWLEPHFAWQHSVAFFKASPTHEPRGRSNASHSSEAF